MKPFDSHHVGQNCFPWVYLAVRGVERQHVLPLWPQQQRKAREDWNMDGSGVAKPELAKGEDSKECRQ